jgi:tungstate transport system substrate-binding protein
MKTREFASIFCAILFAAAVVATGCGSKPPLANGPAETIRVAVIGGMIDTGFWQALVKQFDKATDHRYKIEVVSVGPKYFIADAFRKGSADLITMHACDTIINLVADGYGVDPQPWLKNDLVIVGPHEDPAGIRHVSSAIEAFKKIAAAKAPFVVHSSLGAQEVMRDVLHAGEFDFPSEHLTMLFTERARDVLKVAAEKHAYTMVGRIPFLNGKLPNVGLELMVRGDPQLRRPYVVVTADPRRFSGANCAGAKVLAGFLRTKETQDWIETYGIGQLDKQPVFFPIAK